MSRFFLRWIPKEHGSWAFLFEPILAALGVFPCVGGAWLALSCVGLFFLRLPVRSVAGVFGGRRWDWEAGGVTLGLGAVVGVSFYFSEVWAKAEVLPFLGVAGVAGGIFLVADFFGQRRKGWAECAGALAFDAFLPIVFLLGGVSSSVAWWFFGVRVFRSWSAVGMVRQVLRLQKEGGDLCLRKVLFSASSAWHGGGFLLWVGAGALGFLPTGQLLVLQGFLAFRYYAFFAWMGLKKREHGSGGIFRVSPWVVGVMESFVGLVWVALLIGVGRGLSRGFPISGSALFALF